MIRLKPAEIPFQKWNRQFIKSPFSSQKCRGFSIVEILIAIGIMSIISLAMATLMANQNKEVAAIDEKMALQNVQTLVMNLLSNPPYCKCFIDTRTFNELTNTWNSFPTSISASFDAACAPVGAAVLTKDVAISDKLLPNNILIQNIVETTAGSGVYSANLQILFDQTKLTRSRRSISVPIYFKVNLLLGVAGARPLLSCSSATTGSVDLLTLCGQLNGFYNGTTCEPTYQP